MTARQSSPERLEFCGLQIDSTIRFSELRAGNRDSAADLVIANASPRNLRAIPRGSHGAVTATIDEGSLAIRVPMAGGLWVRPGRMEVAASSSRWHARLRPYVLGTGLAAAMYQLGLVPFHVSAVALSGAAVAFSGESGAGKSTFSYAWQRRFGAQMVSDDIARIECDGNGEAVVYPGLLQVKMWKDSLQAFDLGSKGLARDIFRADKYLLSPERLAKAVCPLCALILLETSPLAKSARIQRLDGVARVQHWLASAYRADLGSALGAGPILMRAAVALAGKVPLYRLERPRLFASMNDDADLVLDRLRRDGCLPP